MLPFNDHPIKVSADSCRLRFHGCEPEYIRTTCHARCCESSVRLQGTWIAIHPREQPEIEARGGVVKDGLLQTPRKVCPFKTEVHLCSLHTTPYKPMGCIVSPFTLNANDTLIVRNRYKLLKCYNVEPRLPAYVAFKASLVLLFGDGQVAALTRWLDRGGGDVMLIMRHEMYEVLRYNERSRKGLHDATLPVVPASG